MRTKSHFYKIIGFLAAVSALTILASACKKAKPTGPEEYAIKMAESVMARRPHVYSDWDYVTGVMMKAFEGVWNLTDNDKFYQYIVETVDSVVQEDGSILDYHLGEYNIDEIFEGRAVLFLYEKTKAEKYKIAADTLRSQLSKHPRTSEGGFWHKKRYPYQMWLDGLYMGSPFYAEYTRLFGPSEAFDDVVRQFVLMETHARNTESGLLYHAWDEKKEQEWADPVSGLSPCFWGRGTGWYAMALVDVLDQLPADHPGRETLIAILQRLAPAILSVQDDASGVWWQVLNMPAEPDNYLEASASSMFVYALAKGVRNGYLDKAIMPSIEKAYHGLLDTFITENPDGTLSLNGICKTAGLGYGRDGSYDYYVHQEKVVSNDGKGVGPFILACVEMHLLENMKEAAK